MAFERETFAVESHVNQPTIGKAMFDMFAAVKAARIMIVAGKTRKKVWFKQFGSGFGLNHNQATFNRSCGWSQ